MADWYNGSMEGSMEGASEGMNSDPVKKNDKWYPNTDFINGGKVSHYVKNRFSGEEIEIPQDTIRKYMESTIDSLDQLDFSRQDLERIILQNRKMCDVSLRESNLKGSNLKGVDFRGADLRGANLSDADLTSAIFDENTSIDATTNFAGADVSGADLSRVKLSTAQAKSVKNLRFAKIR
jgi:uncharacterized protein YjbI with pentapeptide repeats